MKQLQLLSLAFLSLLLLVSGCNSAFKINKSVPPANSANVSISYPSFPERAYHSSTLLNNGNVLFVGGEDNNNPLSVIEIYNPTQNTITQTTPLNFARSSHTATLLGNGKVLIVGGYEADSWNPIDSVEIFNPENNSLFIAATLNETRAYHTATLLNNGKVLVVGGYDVDWNLLNTAEIYDPETNVWTPVVATMSVERGDHTASILPDGRVLIVAGQSNSVNLATVEIFNPQDNSWSMAQPLSMGRYNHSASVLADGKILVVGGYDQSWAIQNTAEIYNPGDGTWTATANLQEEASGHTSTLLSNGKVAVIGGYRSRSYGQLVQLYDPIAGTWTTAASLTHGRYEHTATLLANGKVVVAGGQAGGYVDTVELYHPTSNTVSMVAYPSPKILSVATNTHGAKNAGDIIDFKVTFSEEVVISGSPRLALDVGGSTIYANATTTAASTIHNFRYVVSASDTDNDGLSMSSPLELNGGKILSVVSHTPANLNFSVSDISTIAVHYDGPTVLAVTAPTNGVYRAGYYMDFVVTFSEPVAMTGLSAAVIEVKLNGVTFYANGIKGPASTTRIFRLVVPSGYTDSDGIELAPTLSLPWGGTLVSAIDGTPLFKPYEGIDTSGLTTLDRLALPFPRSYQTENFLADGRSIVIGGLLDSGSVVTNSVEIYNPVANTWTAMAPMNFARANHHTFILNDGRILVAGGTDFIAAPAYAALTSAEIYNPVANSWTVVASMNQGRFGSQGLVLSDGRVIMVAGRGESWSFLDSVEIYNPVANTWTTKAPLTGGAQAQHELALMPDGSVYVVGGYNWGVPAPDEIIDPNL